MPTAQEMYQNLCDTIRNITYIERAQALLEWDQQTMLPKNGGAYRAEQITYIAGEIHRRRTDPRLGELLNSLAQSDLASDPNSDCGATIRELKRVYEKKAKLPNDLVERSARAAANGHQIWVDARKENDFKKFAPILKQIFALKREECEAIGYETCPYDVLLDDYEPYARTSEVSEVLAALKKELVPLVAAIRNSNLQPDPTILRREFPVAAQETFLREASTAIGFDYDRGRLDVTHHPFCTEIGPSDVRLTTRYDKNFFNSAFFGTLHEAGHGIYEQGLRDDVYGLPPGEYCSLGIHESQSRLWENLVGRSRAFWQHFYPRAQELFAGALSGVSLESFFGAVNHVAPSLIRVEADEATYNLHIIIRFELEQDVMDGKLETDDLPDAWNEKYEQALGIRPDSDANGVMQDIHWSAGLVGYFSTYALGNLYASQFFHSAQEELGDLQEMFSRGEFLPLKQWLNREIHQRGKRYPATELGKMITGEILDHQRLIVDLRDKLSPIYGL